MAMQARGTNVPFATKAGIASLPRYVHVVCRSRPNALQQNSALFDHLVGAGKHRQRHVDIAAHTRRSFNSTDPEPIVRQWRRRCFIPAFSFGNLEQYLLSAISALAERAVAAFVPR